MSRQYTIGLSSSSVYPESTAVAFELAADLGYDGVEVMVGTDAMSQDLADLERPGRSLPITRSCHPRAVSADHSAGMGDRPVGKAC